MDINSHLELRTFVETNVDTSIPNERPSKCSRIQSKGIDCDLGSRKQIYEFPVNEQDEIQRAYLIVGLYQPKNIEYPYKGLKNHCHSFQSSWFESHSNWLEYSPSRDAIYCLTCYLFGKKPTGSDAFTEKCFNNWKKVKDGMNCSLFGHDKKDPNTPHIIDVKCCEDLMNYSGHIDKLVEKQTSKEIENNQLRLKTSIECAQWLAFQACAFRDHDESLDSKNRGNFIKLIKHASTFNENVAKVVLENAPRNAKYTSPTIQKEILHILAIVHVRDTIALTLKNEICAVLSRYNLHIENIRSQGYDGATDMRGEWNGLQALFLKDCPYAYYVHCMAHSKRNDELQYTQAEQVENMIASNEIETGRDANQIVISTISEEGANYKQRNDAEGAYQLASSSAGLKMGSREIRKNQTLLCAPIMAETVDKMVINMDKAKQSGADLVEIRLDSLKNFNPHEDLKTLIKECPLPTLFTYRFTTWNSL
ncbi:uncharacterized protein LOC142624827 [Castanea sativa]|uniref:uncharacterized protein LOC142624827 n=1 Tax=Castanea sativa TaxID=21020 RepID=UPI003F64E6DB